jgi:hypothetical protein
VQCSRRAKLSGLLESTADQCRDFHFAGLRHSQSSTGGERDQQLFRLLGLARAPARAECVQVTRTSTGTVNPVVHVWLRPGATPPVHDDKSSVDSAPETPPDNRGGPSFLPSPASRALRSPSISLAGEGVRARRRPQRPEVGLRLVYSVAIPRARSHRSERPLQSWPSLSAAKRLRSERR